MAGARMLGLDHRIGPLTPGKPADIVLIATDRPNMIPVHDPVASIVVHANAADVDSVMVVGARRGTPAGAPCGAQGPSRSGGGPDIRTVVSGPQLSADWAAMIGSHLVVEADDRAAVGAYVADDPFLRGGVWGTAAIERFAMRVDNRG